MNDLIYNGKPIRDRDEMLCLTDMWKAAGSDPNRRPNDWIRYEGAPFVEFIVENFKGVRAPHEVIQTLRGGLDASTWAHWQIGLAYAKYLSPPFHVWCNDVIRAHMEGKLVPAPVEEDRKHLISRALIEACKEIDEQRQQIAELEPDANAFRHIAQSEGSQNLTETAKLLRINRDGKDGLITWLQQHRWIYRRAGNKEWLGYDAHTKNGDLEHVPHEIGDKYGKVRIVEQVRITMQGIAKLAKIFSNIAA